MLAEGSGAVYLHSARIAGKRDCDHFGQDGAGASGWLMPACSFAPVHYGRPEVDFSLTHGQKSRHMLASRWPDAAPRAQVGQNGNIGNQKEVIAPQDHCRRDGRVVEGA